MPSLVAIDATPTTAFVDALRRVWDAGDAVLPVDPRLPAPARTALLDALGAGRPVEPGDALVVATSGSTGAPKGVVLTAGAVRAAALAVSRRHRVDPAADHWLACLPLSHVGGLSVVLRALVTGTRLTVRPSFDPAVDATLVSLVPTLLDRVDAGRYRVVLVGGAADRRPRGPNFVHTWGMTETAGGVVHDGVPLDGVEVRTGAGGQLFVRGPMVLRCYRDGTDPKDAEGWLPTGDVGTVGPGRRVAVLGRRDELIVTGGENVWPADVEQVLRTHPAVADVAVLGRDDPEWGQRVVAVVVAADPSDPPVLDALRAFVKERRPAFAAPRELVLATELPRTALGKLARSRLAAAFSARFGPDSDPNRAENRGGG